MKIETIFGPPGTGKTRALVEMAQSLRVPVTFLSFTKAAALEAAGRAEGDVTCSTIHSLAFKQLNLNRQSVVTPRKLAELGAIAGVPFKGTDGAEEKQEGDEYLAVLSYARNRLIPESEAYDHFGRPGTPARFKMLLNAYENWKSTFGYMDFDDMLTQASKIHFPPLPVVMLDEAQDCSPLQWLVFTEICADAKRVIVAGDDDQAIYEWSGADPHAMIRMANSTKTLKQSWRLPNAVYEFAIANALSGIKQRVVKIWDPANRVGLVRRWGDFDDVVIDWKRDTLILCRDNYRLREIQRALHDKKIPYAMATKNSPYENRFARAIRGWTRDGIPLADEQEAMLSLSDAWAQEVIKAKDWAALRKRSWRQHLAIPVHMIDFYEYTDLFLPLNIRLSTIHQAKGSEADVVILDLALTPRVEHGIDLDRDAELRVMYVGLTRARHELHLCGENQLIK